MTRKEKTPKNHQKCATSVQSSKLVRKWRESGITPTLGNGKGSLPSFWSFYFQKANHYKLRTAFASEETKFCLIIRNAGDIFMCSDVVVVLCFVFFKVLVFEHLAYQGLRPFSSTLSRGLHFVYMCVCMCMYVCVLSTLDMRSPLLKSFEVYNTILLIGTTLCKDL